MGKKIKWGIIGPGNIAHTFAQAFAAVEDGELYAVASRSLERANEFADTYNMPKRYGSYEELAADPEVEAVYIATPHPFHNEYTIMCLNAGKNVLCEKPIALNASWAREMFECARQNKRFLMEAMWTRFLPVYYKVEEWIQKGLIGDVRILTADFGYRETFDTKGLVFDPDLAGGALLDVGIYPVSLASLIFKEAPAHITGMAHLGETGVDEQSAMILGYDKGQLAILYSAVSTDSKHEARILGTKGSIYIPDFYRASKAVLEIPGEEPRTVEYPHPVKGYCYEIREANRCIKEGKLQNDRMPWDESVTIMETMDRIREQWGLKYPME